MEAFRRLYGNFESVPYFTWPIFHSCFPEIGKLLIHNFLILFVFVNSSGRGVIFNEASQADLTWLHLFCVVAFCNILYF